MRVPEPLNVPWSFKSVDSAKSWIDELPDGRVAFCIEHELLRGVSPEMIIWFLNHMTDLIEVGGQTVQQYRLWHPRDHISMTYLKPGTDGRNFGPGAQLRIQEAFQADLKHTINIKATVDFLDRSGFAHHERMAGLQVARMDYSFTETPEGTLYKNSLTVGLEGASLIAKFVNNYIGPRVFSRKKGVAWIQHNIEEVGAFESFLPGLYGQGSQD
jgi:hypothetical protein